MEPHYPVIIVAVTAVVVVIMQHVIYQLERREAAEEARQTLAGAERQMQTLAARLCDEKARCDQVEGMLEDACATEGVPVTCQKWWDNRCRRLAPPGLEPGQPLFEDDSGLDSPV